MTFWFRYHQIVLPSLNTLLALLLLFVVSLFLVQEEMTKQRQQKTRAQRALKSHLIAVTPLGIPLQESEHPIQQSTCELCPAYPPHLSKFIASRVTSSTFTFILHLLKMHIYVQGYCCISKMWIIINAIN